MLWDKYPELPYHAVANWPRIYVNDTMDWIEAQRQVEQWLIDQIGPHWVEWTWSMWTLHHHAKCGVSFRREQSTTLFLLRWG